MRVYIQRFDPANAAKGTRIINIPVHARDHHGAQPDNRESEFSERIRSIKELLAASYW
jgi:hypothetical protein